MSVSTKKVFVRKARGESSNKNQNKNNNNLSNNNNNLNLGNNNGNSIRRITEVNCGISDSGFLRFPPLVSPIINSNNKQARVVPSSIGVLLKEEKEKKESVLNDDDFNDMEKKRFVYIPEKAVNREQLKEKNEIIRAATASISTFGGKVNKLPKIPYEFEGQINQDDFIDCLEIYETIQNYYNTRKLLGIMNKTIMNKLSILEEWFCKIIEPRPKRERDEKIIYYKARVKDWEDREMGKVETGYSGYCDEDLIPFISSISNETIRTVKRYQRGLFE